MRVCEMKCPACGGFLSTKKYETEQIDQCNRCQGVWLDWGEVVNIIKSRDEKISHKVKTKVLALKGQDHRNNTEIKCPKCSKTMDTFEYAFNSGVIVDKCPDKHGLWLDGGELEKIQAIFEMIDLKTGVSYENDDELKSKKKCPRDGVLLKEISYESVKIDLCAACGGVWADNEELKQIVRDKETKFLRSDYTEIRPEKGARTPVTELDLVDELECVICADPMERINYSYDSGVIIDRCRIHGTWLDKDELNKIQVFVERWDKHVDRKLPQYGQLIKKANEQAANQFDKATMEAKEKGANMSMIGRFFRKF